MKKSSPTSNSSNNSGNNSMVGKTVLVTGATNGVGQSTAEALAAMGARVFVHGRNPDKGAKTVASIQASTGNKSVEFIESDFSDLGSVHRMVNQFQDRTDRLDVLINNAGGIFKQRQLTKDGFEWTFGINHLAHFVLTNLLLDLLKASAPARIVNVSSIAHWLGKMDFEDLHGSHHYGEFNAYCKAKLANLLFTQELTKRLAGSGVTANALHPGGVRSGFGMNNESGLSRLVMLFFSPVLVSPQRGAETSVYLASSPEVAEFSGGYFSNCKPARTSKRAKDSAAAEKLWDMSLEMCGLTSAV